MQRRYILDAVFYAILAGLVLIYCQKNARNIPDDAFITYRYAQNFLAGNGLVFNVGEHFYGSTAMGFALLLAGVTSVVRGVQGLLDFKGAFDIPDAAVLVTGLSLFLIAVCWYKILRRQSLSIPVWIGGLAIGIYFVTCFYSNYVESTGMEVYTYFALLSCASYLFVFASMPVASGMLMAVAVALRPDAVLFAGILFCVSAADYYIHDRGDKKKLMAILTAACLLGIGVFMWESFLYLYFHSLKPETMLAKKAQVLLGYWPVFSVDTIVSGIKQRGFPGFLYAIGFVLAALPFLSRNALVRKDFFSSDVSNRLLMSCIVWLLFGIGLVAAYSSFYITTWPWYEVPIYFALLNASLSAVPLLFFEWKAITGKEKPAAVLLAGAVLVGLMSAPKAPGYINYWRKQPIVNEHLTSYDPIVDYLHKNEPGGTTIATAEPGAMGYHLGPAYKVIDYLGLISPGVARSIIEGDRDYYYNRWKPDYIIISWPGDRMTPEKLDWFKENYRLTGEFHHPYWQKALKRGAYLYKRI